MKQETWLFLYAGGEKADMSYSLLLVRAGGGWYCAHNDLWQVSKNGGK